MHGTKYPAGQRWVKVNTAGTLRYNVTSVLHNEVKECGFYVLILRISCVYEDEVSSPIFSSAKVSLNRIRGAGGKWTTNFVTGLELG
jgi:hypothetical protein